MSISVLNINLTWPGDGTSVNSPKHNSDCLKNLINENITRQRQMYRGPWCYRWMGMDGYEWVGRGMVLISFTKTISTPANIKLQGPGDLFEVCSQTFLLHALQ